MPLDAMVIVGRFLAAREQAKLTQAEVAEAAGISVETVSRIERGMHEPELSTAIAIARALGYELTLVGEPALSLPPPERPTPTPLVRLLSESASRLDPTAQSALLRMSELLEERMPVASGRRGRRP
jgi:transcriptional regulator with XRE-family HTH domain